MSLNPAVNRVANGRRLAARRIVMNTLASVDSQVWRKRVVYNNPTDPNVPSDPLSFEANALSQMDEPNYEYDFIGMAFVLADKFNGGYISKNYTMNNPTDITIMAQIEAYDEGMCTLAEQINFIIDLELREGDLLGLMIYADFMIWFEIVAISGQTMMSDFGRKYVLNRRDELSVNPIKDELINRTN